MRLNIFTGGKGGIGKTLCALCCSVYYLSKPTTSIVDLNFNNPDLFKIIYGKSLSDDEDYKTKKNEYNIREVGRGVGNNRIICKQDFFSIPNGIVGIWEEIRNVCKILNNCDDIIIDTNYNVASLFSFKDKNEADTVLKLISDAGITRLKIWMIWSFNLLTDIGEPDRVVYADNIKTFEELCDRNLFKETRDLIHILNPYKFFRDKKMNVIEELVKRFAEYTRKQIKVGEAGIIGKKGITFNQLVGSFVNSFKDCNNDTTVIFEKLLTAIQTSNDNLPVNVCFIPYYMNDSNAKNYIEDLSSNPPIGDVRLLVENVELIYKTIVNCIEHNNFAR